MRQSYPQANDHKVTWNSKLFVNNRFRSLNLLSIQSLDYQTIRPCTTTAPPHLPHPVHGGTGTPAAAGRRETEDAR